MLTSTITPKQHTFVQDLSGPASAAGLDTRDVRRGSRASLLAASCGVMMKVLLGQFGVSLHDEII